MVFAFQEEAKAIVSKKVGEREAGHGPERITLKRNREELEKTEKTHKTIRFQIKNKVGTF